MDMLYPLLLNIGGSILLSQFTIIIIIVSGYSNPNNYRVAVRVGVCGWLSVAALSIMVATLPGSSIIYVVWSMHVSCRMTI